MTRTDHVHPRYLHLAHRGRASRTTRLAIRIAAFCGAAAFGPAFLYVSSLWWAGNALFHGPDQYPYIAYTGAISVLAILMSWLILLATNHQSQLDRQHAENAYHQIAELLHLNKQEQMDLLAKILDSTHALHILLTTAPGTHRDSGRVSPDEHHLNRKEPS